MWWLNEDNDELKIIGFPIIMWSLCLLCLGFGIYFFYGFFGGFADFSSIIASLTENFPSSLITLLALSFVPLIGLVILYFYPLVITKVNRNEKTVTVKRLGISGKKVQKYGFADLKGGFRVKSEEDEDNNESLKLYFDLNSGKRVFLSSDWTEFWKGKAYDVAMKANEYLRPKNP